MPSSARNLRLNPTYHQAHTVRMRTTLTRFGIASILLATFTLAPAAHAATKVRGYLRSNGTYVQSYHRSTSNSISSDNYSTKGNVNPYTGKKGTKAPKKLR